ncbi:2-hydroxyisoflavanone dehydratase-like [Solanum stenotomum]|uniref:2-hydroxyisoflavanone dehydratase-like n=1 Tax=Solanum stenotomum TaxID=172797 RepID=UPI0020D10583|nr:2-hydroxyisoflavanone dehydratase-like [Solanum stenotomum]
MVSLPTDEIAHDFPPFFRVYKDGRVERFHNYVYVHPSDNFNTGVRSKDVNNNSARLYLLKITEKNQKFPLLIYIHGGGFSIESAFSSGHDKYLHSIVTKANVVAISIDYRLAPEHLLPTCYDDSWSVIRWTSLHVEMCDHLILTEETVMEPWLKDHVDFSRVFLAGESAGANIVHDMVVRASASEKPLGEGFKIAGISLIHLFFGNDEVDEYCSFIFPECEGLDDPRLNPAAHLRLLSSLICRKVMIFTAEKDFLRERSLTYYDALKKSGWNGEVEIMETQGEDHVFHLLEPKCEKAGLLMKRLVEFFNEKI